MIPMARITDTKGTGIVINLRFRVRANKFRSFSGWKVQKILCGIKGDRIPCLEGGRPEKTLFHSFFRNASFVLAQMRPFLSVIMKISFSEKNRCRFHESVTAIRSVQKSQGLAGKGKEIFSGR